MHNRQGYCEKAEPAPGAPSRAKGQSEERALSRAIMQPVPSTLRSRYFLWSLLAIVALALLVRLLVCWSLANCPAVVNPLSITDMETYRRLALDIRQGVWPQFFDYQPFYYAVFLPLLWLVFPAGAVWPVMVAQALLGAATVWLTGLSAARLGGRRAGLVAAVLLAVARQHIFFTPFLLFEVMQAFWMSLLCWLGLQAWQRNRWRDWCWLALAAALANLTRGNIVLFLPGFLVFLVCRQSGAWRRSLGLTAVCLALFLLPQLPFAIRNSLYAGRLCGASVAGGKVLVLGNSPEAPPGGLEYPRTYESWLAMAAPTDGSEPVPVSRNILRWICQEPLIWLELTFRKFLLYWNWLEIPNNISLEQEGRGCPWLLWPIFLPFGIFSCLGLAGCLVLARRGGSKQLWVLHSVLVSCLATVAFYILARFRIAALPALAIAGAIALTTAWRLARTPQTAEHNQRNRYSWLALGGLVGIFLAFCAYDRYSQSLLPAVMRWLRPQGIVVTTPRETVVYDHASLVLGNQACLTAETAPIEAEKVFLVPAKFADSQEVTVLLRCEATSALTSVPGATATLNGKPLDCRGIVSDRMTRWLAFTGELLTPADRRAVFAFHLPRGGVPGVYIDFERDYGRSKILSQGQWEVLPGEFTAELVLPTKP